MIALVTGAGGLIGSACVSLLCGEGWDVAGIDNDMRRWFFGEQGATSPNVEFLCSRYPSYRHHDLDIRDRQGIRELMAMLRPHFIIHAAAQPSHDLAAKIPYEDFDVNATGTLNLLAAAREFCPESPFCLTSTNKVYGDRPNQLELVELEKRWDYADASDGIDESMPIDQCLHSLMGASKLAGDILCQEFGRYFRMPVGIFRGGCLTGPQHAGVELHGYLSYIVHCAVHGKPYTVFGYKAKQVRDQIHATDVARLFLEFFNAPRVAEVYNLGGGRARSISVLETIDWLTAAGHRLDWRYNPQHRRGDHICYISDLRKLQAHFPAWKPEYSLDSILEEILRRQSALRARAS